MIRYQYRFFLDSVLVLVVSLFEGQYQPFLYVSSGDKHSSKF